MIRRLQILSVFLIWLASPWAVCTQVEAGEVTVIVDCVPPGADHDEVKLKLKQQDSVVWVSIYEFKITELKPTKPYTTPDKAPHPFYRKLPFFSRDGKKVSSGPPDEEAVGKYPNHWQEYKTTIVCTVDGKEVTIDPHISIHGR